MDFRHHISGGSPSSSSTTSSSSHNHHHNNHNNLNGTNALTTTTSNNNNNDDPIHSWWESISKARSHIHQLSTLLPSPDPISSLADSDSPALSLLSSPTAYSALSSSLTSSPLSGSGHDSLCNWLYDTFLSSDPHLKLVVLSFIPLITHLYLSRIHSTATSSSSNSPSLAGFEAVLLALYSSETKSRGGKPVVVSIPDLSQPSLYQSPRVSNSKKKQPNSAKVNPNSGSVESQRGCKPSVGVLSPALEPQTAIKSTKRGIIVGVALDCYYKQVSQMPSWSKHDFCRFAASWAGQDCACKSEFDELDRTVTGSSDGIGEDEIEVENNVVENMRNLEIEDDVNDVKGGRIMLPWELMQPMLRILGHCLLGPLNANDVKDAASVAVRCLYARASHDLVPQAILATRSLIQLDKRTRETAAAAMAAASAANGVGSNGNTPTKAKKPEILLVSK